MSRRLKELYNQEIVGLQNVMQRFGMPGIALPSANLYAAHMKYDVDLSSPQVHPAMALMNARHFNIDPSKSLLDSMIASAASPMTFNQLVSGMAQLRPDRNLRPNGSQARSRFGETHVDDRLRNNGFRSIV